MKIISYRNPLQKRTVHDTFLFIENTKEKMLKIIKIESHSSARNEPVKPNILSWDWTFQMTVEKMIYYTGYKLRLLSSMNSYMRFQTS